MSVPTPDWEYFGGPLEPELEKFATARNPANAKKILRLHPDLRSLSNVTSLMNRAASWEHQGRPRDEITRTMERGALLLGTDEIELPQIAAHLDEGAKANTAGDLTPGLVSNTRRLLDHAEEMNLVGKSHQTMRPTLLKVMSIAYASLFRFEGLNSYLDDALETAWLAVSTIDETTSDRAAITGNLGVRLSERHKVTLDPKDLFAALIYTELAENQATDPVQRLRSSGNRAEYCYRFYEITGDADYLLQAIELGRLHQNLWEHEETHVAHRWHNLTGYYLSLFQATSLDVHIAKAIECGEAAVARATDLPRPHRFTHNLAHAYLYRFQSDGHEEDLARSLDCAAKAAQTPSTPPDESASYQNSLAIAQLMRHQMFGARRDLDDAIRAATVAVDESPSGSADLPGRLGTLARCNMRIHDLEGDRTRLDEALRLLRLAVNLPGASAESRSNLATCMSELYRRTSDTGFLESALAMREAVLNVTPTRSVGYPAAASGLAISYKDLYSATGDRSYLEAALEIMSSALLVANTTVDGTPGLHNNAAGLYFDLAAITDDPDHTAAGIFHAEKALHLAKPERADFASFAGTMTQSHVQLYESSMDPDWLDAAIEYTVQCLDLLPSTSTIVPYLLNAKAVCLLHKFEHNQQIDLLNEAIEHAQSALDREPAETTSQTLLALTLSQMFTKRFEVLSDNEDLAEARRLLPERSATGPSTTLRLEKHRSRLARLEGETRTAIDALERALAAYDSELERVRGDLRQLRDLFGQVDGLVGDLAMLHIDERAPERAVEVLRHGTTRMRQGTSPADAVLLDPDDSTVAIFASEDATAMVDLSDYSFCTVDLPRNVIQRAVLDALTASRGEGSRSVESAFDELAGYTSRLTNRLPRRYRMTIAPAGICALLPFSAGRTTSGKYLIEESAVTLLPHIGWRPGTSRGHGTASSSLGVFHQGGSQNTLDLSEDKENFASLFPSSKILSEPSRSEVLRELGRAEMLTHFSCHGVYDGTNALDSRLIVDGHITLADIFETERTSLLVNLSACETSIPDLSRADQLISFPAAFLDRGSEHVLSTLWPVGNTEATQYNNHFYSELNSGTHPADANRLAVLAIISSSNQSDETIRSVVPDLWAGLPDNHPYFWAPFTYYGHNP